MAQETCAHPCIFHGDHIGKTKDFPRARGKVSKVADRPRYDVKPRLQPRSSSFHKDAR